MRAPKPVPGLVIRYAYLWRREYAAGEVEGRKDRPCTVVVAAPTMEGGTRVYVLPITHTAPTDPAAAIQIPFGVKRSLHLDEEASWIVLDEINDFLWPGYDVRPLPHSDPARIDYGVLPPRFFDAVRAAFLDLARHRRVRHTPRD